MIKSLYGVNSIKTKYVKRKVSFDYTPAICIEHIRGNCYNYFI